MNQDYVTRLVVGPSLSVALCQPVVTTGRSREGLRLDGADWVPAGSKQLAADGTQPTGRRTSLVEHPVRACSPIRVRWRGSRGDLSHLRGHVLAGEARDRAEGRHAAHCTCAAIGCTGGCGDEPVLPLPTASGTAGQGGPSGPKPVEAGATPGEAAQAAKSAPVPLEARATASTDAAAGDP